MITYYVKKRKSIKKSLSDNYKSASVTKNLVYSPSEQTQ